MRRQCERTRQPEQVADGEAEAHGIVTGYLTGRDAIRLIIDDHPGNVPIMAEISANRCFSPHFG